MSERNSKPTRFTIGLVDPLFAVALQVGFLRLFEQDWFKQWRVPAQKDEVFYCLVFILGFLTLTLSWIGYHISVEKHPVKSVHRFIIDILLVMLYAAVLIRSHHFGSVLFLLAIIFSLYVIWDLKKINEYPEDYAEHKYRRELISLVFAVLFWLLWYFSEDVGTIAALVLAFFMIIFYRIYKRYDLDQMIGIPKSNGTSS